MKISPDDLHIQLDEATKLVPVDPSMADDVFWLVDNNRELLGEWLPWVSFTKQPTDSEGYLQSMASKLEKDEKFDLAIILNGKPVGMIGVHEIDWGNQSTSVGYWLASAGQGKGIMTRACRALIGYLFANLNLHRVEVRCATENMKSRAIPERLGLVREATLKDAEIVGGKYLDIEVYRALSSEWKL